MDIRLHIEKELTDTQPWIYNVLLVKAMEKWGLTWLGLDENPARFWKKVQIFYFLRFLSRNFELNIWNFNFFYVLYIFYVATPLGHINGDFYCEIFF